MCLWKCFTIKTNKISELLICMDATNPQSDRFPTANGGKHLFRGWEVTVGNL